MGNQTGEPTRVVTSGGPELGGGSVADRLKTFQALHDQFRSAVVNEPRGSDVVVGALLLKSADITCELLHRAKTLMHLLEPLAHQLE